MTLLPLPLLLAGSGVSPSPRAAPLQPRAHPLSSLSPVRLLPADPLLPHHAQVPRGEDPAGASLPARRPPAPPPQEALGDQMAGAREVLLTPPPAPRHHPGPRARGEREEPCLTLHKCVSPCPHPPRPLGRGRSFCTPDVPPPPAAAPRRDAAAPTECLPPSPADTPPCPARVLTRWDMSSEASTGVPPPSTPCIPPLSAGCGARCAGVGMGGSGGGLLLLPLLLMLPPLPPPQSNAGA